jgi:hypothetical protein
MAGGPLFPYSIYPDTNGRIYPGPHIGGTNSRVDFGMKVEASLGADSKLHLRFQMPPSIPSGTLKLDVVTLANATSGNAVLNPAWAVVAGGANPDTATLTGEGNTTLTWASGDNDDYKRTKIILDASTAPAAGEVVVMEITFVSASWTLAQVSTWNFSLIWE